MAGPTLSKEIVDLWITQVGPEGWYAVDPALDARLRDTYATPWAQLRAGAFRDWGRTAQGALAYLILADQFSRNMFRDDPRGFATDAQARRMAVSALARGLDHQIAAPERQFFYMPLMHSESLPDQERCVRMFLLRISGQGGSNLRHARAHRAVIRQFGRFPTRNAALSRSNSEAEQMFLQDGGYGAVLRGLPD